MPSSNPSPLSTPRDGQITTPISSPSLTLERLRNLRATNATWDQRLQARALHEFDMRLHIAPLQQSLRAVHQSYLKPNLRILLLGSAPLVQTDVLPR